METLSYEYPKTRKEFGQHPSFADTTPHVESVLAAQDPASPWLERLATTVEIESVPTMAAHQVNTEIFLTSAKGCHHVDGAWPPEVKTTEFQDKQRLLRRIRNEPSYMSAVVNLSKNAEQSIMQNNTIDLYEEYFADDSHPHSYSPPSCKTVSVFRDPNEVKRSATKLSWHPEGPNKLAVSYSILQFQQTPSNMDYKSYIWDVHNPNNPDAELLPPSPLTSIVYNPRSPDHIVGGCYNGIVGFWDLRKGSLPVECSTLEKTHRDPVYDIFWIQSRSGNECASVSTDGQLLWWDIRKLAAGPTDSMILQGTGDAVFGGTSLEYRSDAGATRYLVGTEQGVTLLCDRKAKKDSDSQKVIRTTYGARHGKHHGPVYSVQRNPVHPKYFLTVGDWSAKVWMEDQKAPIMSTKYDSSYLTAGTWSPTRCGVFYTIKMDGSLDCWDFFHKQNDPIFTTKVSEHGLCSIKVQQQGKLIALGGIDGTTTILEVSDALSEGQREEKQAMGLMFERETKREKNLELRQIQRKRDKKEQKKKAELVEKGKAPAQEPEEVENVEQTAQLLKSVEDQFYSLIDINPVSALKEEADAHDNEREPEQKEAADDDDDNA